MPLLFHPFGKGSSLFWKSVKADIPAPENSRNCARGTASPRAPRVPISRLPVVNILMDVKSLQASQWCSSRTARESLMHRPMMAADPCPCHSGTDTDPALDAYQMTCPCRKRVSRDNRTKLPILARYFVPYVLGSGEVDFNFQTPESGILSRDWRLYWRLIRRRFRGIGSY
jgi:hypothetical protein